MSNDAETLALAEAAHEAFRKAPKFRHTITELEGEFECESYTYSTPEGAIELWRRKHDRGYFGGVEVHSAKRGNHCSKEPSQTRCKYTASGECWHDGSSLAFDEFEHSFDLPSYVKLALADWHRNQFGGTE